LRSWVKNGATIRETSINRGVSSKMSLRERKRKRIASNATMSAAVDIEEAGETSEGRHPPPGVTEAVARENTRLVRQTISGSREEMTRIAHLGIVMGAVGHLAIVGGMTDADTDK
jgi:hypothetical protein